MSSDRHHIPGPGGGTRGGPCSCRADLDGVEEIDEIGRADRPHDVPPDPIPPGRKPDEGHAAMDEQAYDVLELRRDLEPPAMPRLMRPDTEPDRGEQAGRLVVFEHDPVGVRPTRSPASVSFPG